jgi:hypothetical protein
MKTQSVKTRSRPMLYNTLSGRDNSDVAPSIKAQEASTSTTVSPNTYRLDIASSQPVEVIPSRRDKHGHYRAAPVVKKGVEGRTSVLKL